MKLLLIFICACSLSQAGNAQVLQPVTSSTEQQIENGTQSDADQETEDDSYLQQLAQLIRDPANLNDADLTEFGQLHLLSAVQLQSLARYRALFGNLVDLYELQAIPGWDISTIQKIRPYITVSASVPAISALRNRFKNGVRVLLLRITQVPERSRGYLADSAAGGRFYQGSPQKILARFGYNYKNLLQYGIVAEKDAGEQFFKGRQKNGFDFYSVHLFIRRAGIIKSLAIGDYTVNMGQGLIQWQSLSFKKSADAMNIKREGEIIRPYNSAGEINFHRGIAITVAKSQWQFTLFGSYKKIDANIVADTAQNQQDFVSSFQTSGYHRTKNEMDDKGVQRQLVYGGNFSCKIKTLHFGINAVRYAYKLPLVKSADLYNKYAFTGRRLANYSLDFSYTHSNIHLFGEAAVTAGLDKAFVGGLLISPSSKADISLLYRNISESYQSFYSNAFTESTYPANEKGLYAGISIKPGSNWRIDAYADFYKFPWVRYRVDAPASGCGYLLQLMYKPARHLEVYFRYKAASSPGNNNPGLLTLPAVLPQLQKNLRMQVMGNINTIWSARFRADMVWYDRTGIMPENGFLTYMDIIYKPLLRPYSANARLQYFETDGYNSRLYAYENDVLYSFSIPAFYNKGYRYYINLSYEFAKKLTAWVRWAQSVYEGKSLIGTGLDEIKGSVKSDIRLQLVLQF